MFETCFAAISPISSSCKAITLFFPVLMAGLLLGHAFLLGQRFTRKRETGGVAALLAIGYGTLTDALVMFALAHLGFLVRPFAWVYLAIPFALLGARIDLSRVRVLWNVVGQKIRSVRYFEWFILVFLFVRFSFVIIPQSQGDPLYYHVSSAWLWSRASKAYFIDWLPWSLQGGLAEYLYTWVATLVGERFSLLLSAQALHAAFGILLSPFVAFCIARLFLSRNYALMVLLAASTFPGEVAMLIRAKNDGFVLFFSLLAIFMILQMMPRLTKRGVCAVALFTGAALGVKHTAAFVALPTLAVLYVRLFLQRDWTKGQRLRIVTLAIIITLLICAPVLGRNWVYTGNPFFPAFDGFFHSIYLNASINEIVSGFSYTPGSIGEIIWSNLSRFILSKPWYLIGVLAPLWVVPQAQTLVKIGWGSFVLLALVTGKGRYERFGFSLFSVFALLGSVTAMNLAKVLKVRWKLSPRFTVLLGLLFILTGSGAEVPFKQLFSRVLPFVFSTESPAQSFSADFPLYDMHVWMNSNLRPGKVLSLYQNENLFLDMPMSTPENEVRANEVRFADTKEKVHAALLAGGFRYVLVPGIAADYCPILLESARSGVPYKVIHELHGIKLLEIPQS